MLDIKCSFISIFLPIILHFKCILKLPLPTIYTLQSEKPKARGEQKIQMLLCSQEDA